MPSFLNPTAALIAASIVVPSLLVLYFLKLRRKEFDVPSTLLWKKAVQDLQVNAPFQRLRRNLLLLLQLLILIAMVLAFSRPVTNVTKPPGKLTVLLIDRSASMSAKDPEYKGRSRLDEAKMRAKEIVSSLDKDGSAMVIAFDDSAKTIQPFTNDAGLLKRKIDSIEPSDRKTKLKLAYQLADAQANFNIDQLRSNVKPDVRLFSDGRVLDAAELSLVGNLTFEPIGTEKAGNIAIVSLSAKRNYERPTQVQIFARLANYGTEVKQADVQLSVDGSVRSIAATTLTPDRWTDQQRDEAQKAGVVGRESVDFTIELTQSAVIKVEQMNKEGDCLSADDVAQVVVPPARSLTALLVTQGNYFLEKMINAKSLHLKDPVTITPTKYEAGVTEAYDLIIFDRHQPKSLPPAGSFIYFGAVPPEGVKLSAQKIGGKIATETGMVGVLDWKRDHPILRGVTSLSKLYVSDPIKLNVPNEAEVLIDGMKGPLAVLYREGQRTHLVIPFDVGPSTWPLIVSFPVFMVNSIQFLAIGSEMDVRQSVDPGATPRIPRTALQKIGGESIKSVRVSGPMGSRDETIPPTGDFALSPLEKVGLYTLDPPIPQYEQIAVNLLDATESNLLPQTVAPGGIGAAVLGETAKSRMELWWWLLACLALPLLLIEWWVYTRRVHL